MSTQLAVMDTRYGFSPEGVEVIKKTIAPGVSDDELALFLMVCQKTGLDPFSRQIYLSERKSKDQYGNWVSKKTPETTIDGFRVIAERSGQYAGQLGPFWCGPEGDWKDVWLGSDMPSAAKVGILRHDFKEPVWGIALFCEYVQTKADGKPNSMWTKMGANQLAKCAESLGLRKAFPRDLSGMYSKEEMAQAEERGSKQAIEETAQRRIAEESAKLKRIPAGSEISPARMADVEPMRDPAHNVYPELRGTPEYESRMNAVKPPPRLSEFEPVAGAVEYEQRHAKVIEEANAVLDEAKRPSKWEPSKDKMLKKFKEMKAALKQYSPTKDYSEYYAAIETSGKKHADELSEEEGKAVWKAMEAIRRTLKRDAELRLEVEAHALRIGPYAIEACLKNHGLQSIEDVIGMESEAFQSFIKELQTTA